MEKIVVVGSMNMDMVINVSHIPVIGETVLSDKFELIPGGKGGNQAYAVGKLGGDVTMLGAVGADENGERLCESLKEAGVCVEYLKRTTEVPTGTAIITVDEVGNNCIIVIQGANKTVNIPYINKNLEIIKQCDIVLLQLEIPLETVIYVAKKAKEYGKTVILDPAPAIKDLPDDFLACVDLIKPNETELGILLNRDDVKEDLQASTEEIKKRGVKNVLVTLGGDGAYLNDEKGNTYHFHNCDVPVVDTTAAGDSFIGALAVSISKGHDYVSSVEYANRVAELVIMEKGAQSSIPDIQRVEKYIQSIAYKKKQ